MLFFSCEVIILLVVSQHVQICRAYHKQSGTIITAHANTGEGLVYFLLALFLTLNFLTPVFRCLYVRHVASLVEIARIESENASKIIAQSISNSAMRVTHRVKFEFQV
jgi:hypothetical protein